MNQRANESRLNDEQFERFKSHYIHTIVDSMSTKDLYDYVAHDMEDFVNNLTERELYEEVKYTLDEEMLEELLTTSKEELKD
mgnify:FL=1